MSHTFSELVPEKENWSKVALKRAASSAYAKLMKA
eukprot:CAMPEP_0115106336 /NCGR_PEP_ID=MMETSP0227-20121206/36596_1 /TAXON_ID=89957 /ORGANISM="Polarella glacialis, Strain CCMP 1383" /LENGTH=34 /DNA_ID= /DNA_START= /DNA_END= /DNA_ORIENTATION=